MKKIYYPLAMAALFITGMYDACKVPKDTGTQAVQPPAAFRGSTEDTSSIATLPWQEFFYNPELKALIDTALAHNNDLQIALKNMEAARLSFRQASLGNLPVVGLQANAVANRPSDNSLNGLTLQQFLHQQHIEDYTIAASLSWEADIWGKIRSRKAATLAGYLQTQEARNGVQTQLVSDIAKGYYNLLLLRAQISIAQENVALTDSTLRIIRLQYASGKTTSLAVQQAEAQHLDAASLLPQFRQQLAIQENALRILSGQWPDSVQTSTLLEATPLPAKLDAGIPASLLDHRPDVRLSAQVLQQADANVGYAKANLYPSLTITAQGGLDAIKASNWFNIPASLFGTVAGSLTQPLFQQNALRTQLAIAKVRREEAVIAFRQSVLVAVGEVADELVKLDQLQQQQTIVATRVQTLEQATQNARLLFSNGMATYLEVLTAQGSVLQSKLELAALRKTQLDATVDLYRAVGGGWH